MFAREKRVKQRLLPGSATWWLHLHGLSRSSIWTLPFIEIVGWNNVEWNVTIILIDHTATRSEWSLTWSGHGSVSVRIVVVIQMLLEKRQEDPGRCFLHSKSTRLFYQGTGSVVARHGSDVSVGSSVESSLHHGWHGFEPEIFFFIFPSVVEVLLLTLATSRSSSWTTATATSTSITTVAIRFIVRRTWLLLLKTIVMNLFRLKTLGQNSVGNVWLGSHLVHNSNLLLNATWTCASSTIQVIDRSVIGWTRYIVVAAQQLLLIEWTTMITIALCWSLRCWLEKSSARLRMPLEEGGFPRLLLVAGAGLSHYHGWRTEWLNLVRWNRLHWRSMGEISIEVSHDPFVWCRIVGSCCVVEKYRCWPPTRLFCPWMSRETHRWSMALNLVDSVLSLRRLVCQHSP